MKKIKSIAILTVTLMLLAGCQSKVKDVTIETKTTDIVVDNATEPESVSIEQTELMNENGIKITTDSIESDSTTTYLVVNIENTNDTPLTLSCESACINDFMTESQFYEEIPANNTITTGISFFNPDLNVCNITAIASLSFKLTAYDPESFDTIFDTDWMTVKSNIYDTYQQKVDTEGTEIYNAHGITAISKGVYKDVEGINMVPILFLNDSDKDVFCAAIAEDEDTAEYFPDLGCDIPAGKKALRFMYIQDAEEMVNIPDFTEAKAIFTFTDNNNYNEIGRTGVITFKAEPEKK